MKVLITTLFLFLTQMAYGIDTPEKLEGIKIATASEVSNLMKSGAKLYDVRVANEFAEGHIKGAISLPYKEKSKKEVAFDASLDSFDDSKLPDSNMIFQCNGIDCWKSYKASIWANKKMKKQVYWFRGGLPEWQKASLPVEK